MDEQEETKEEQPTEDTGKGNLPESTKLIDDANEAAERLARQNDRKEELLAREERLAIERKLGGKSEGGAEQVKPKAQTPEEYAELVSKGEANPLKDDGFL